MKNYISSLRRLKALILEYIRREKRISNVIREKKVFLEQLKRSKRQEFEIGNDYVCPDDKTRGTGFDRHYLYHPAWAFRKIIREIRPKKHVDISSILYFNSMLSGVLPVEFYDYRPAEIELDDLLCGKADLTNLFFKTNSVESISCMHTVEHIGLGRYGDPIDGKADLQAMDELQRVVAPGGSLLFVTPVGFKNSIYFNAHRVYKPEYIVQQFGKLELKEFFYIPGQEGTPSKIDATSDLLADENYGCGCFWFVKPALHL